MPSRNNKPSNWLTVTVMAIAVACISWLNVNAISHLIRALNIKFFSLVYARYVKFRAGEVTIQVRLASGYLHVEGTRTD